MIARGLHATLDDAPFMVFWEKTQACDLACKHCRADARPRARRRRADLRRRHDAARRRTRDGCPLVVLTGDRPKPPTSWRRTVSTVAPSESAPDAGLRMVRHKIGCLPVVEGDGTLIGIVTEEDYVRWAVAHMKPEPAS